MVVLPRTLCVYNLGHIVVRELQPPVLTRSCERSLLLLALQNMRTVTCRHALSILETACCHIDGKHEWSFARQRMYVHIIGTASVARR